VTLIKWFLKIGCQLRFLSKLNADSIHENLWLRLPEYGTVEREERVELLATILKDYFDTDLPNLEGYCRTPEQKQWFHAKFGEHYRLINSLCKTLKVEKVVEVGTFTGMSALIWLLNGVSLTSVDIVPWHEFEDSVLNEEFILQSDFSQRVLNISDSSSFNEMITEFASSSLIFLDGPKDGIFEQKVVPQIIELMKGSGVWLLLDDIHLRAMEPCWADIKNEKYDLSLIGHASGTGLVLL
jgi:predicted O-methyltransferase YrrM